VCELLLCYHYLFVVVDAENVHLLRKLQTKASDVYVTVLLHWCLTLKTDFHVMIDV